MAVAKQEKYKNALKSRIEKDSVNTENGETKMWDRLKIAISEALEKAKTLHGVDAGYAAGFVAGVNEIRNTVERDPMLLKMDIKSTMKEARAFIEKMKLQGFEAVLDAGSDETRQSWYFKYKGQISIDYEVAIFPQDRKAFISVRARVPE